MHYQVTGQRLIAGGYQLFTASGFGRNEHEAIADALATHPDRAAWKPHELRAEPDPIHLAGLTIGKHPLHGHRARAGKTPAASSNLPTVERMSQGGVCQSSSRHHLHHAATKTATRGAIVVGIALAIESATKAADGGQPISHRTTGLDQTTGPAWVVIGANDPSPRRITGSARGESIFTRSDEALAGQSIHTAEVMHKNPLTQVDGVNPGWVASGPRESISAGFSEMSPVTVATRAGRGMDARKEPFASEFESLPVKTAGPAETLRTASAQGDDWSNHAAGIVDQPIKPHAVHSISVAAWRDTQRPHISEPWLSPDSLGAQSERAVKHETLDRRSVASPTETLSVDRYPLPDRAVTRDLVGVQPCVRQRDAEGSTENNVHPSTGFSAPASVPSRVGGVGNRNATVNDTPHPRAIAGGGPFSTHRLAWLAKAFAASSVILTGISAISAVMLAGRLEEK